MSDQPSQPTRRRQPGSGSPRTRRPPTERKKPKKRGAMKLTDFFDVHIRSGLDDDKVRLTKLDYHKLLNSWMLGAEDVILRGQLDNSELQIVLRGNCNGRLRVSRPDAARKLPLYKVFTTDEIRAKMLEKQGLGINDGAEPASA